MTSVHFITQGCSANVADSEIMAGILKKEGYTIADNIINADVVILNTCTVKGPTESSFKKKLQEVESLGKIIIIAGCIPQAQSEMKLLRDYSLIGTYQIHNIAQVVEETLNGHTVVLLARENSSRLNLPKLRRNDYIEIVPISHGCLGACSFCKTKFARGALYSYPKDEIVRHISSALKEGVKEIWLTSQDLSAYGHDINTNLAELLKDILSIQQKFRLRVGMANPKFILEFLDELVWAFKDERVFKFLHIPVQSGSNRVLKDMNRDYVVEDFKYITKRFKEAIPDITIATDIICGYPTETKDDFEKTLDLIREIRPDVVNISKFWSRPGTVASRLKQIDSREIKRRSNELTELFRQISEENNRKWIGWRGIITITNEGEEELKKDTYWGRNHAYKMIAVESGEFILGEDIVVEIISSTTFHLVGKVVGKN